MVPRRPLSAFRFGPADTEPDFTVPEGIIAGTWYTVQYRGYTMIGPVDPAVAVGLTVFHALVSTVLPIMLAELIFRRIAGVRWLGRRGLAGCLALLALATASGFGPAAHRGVKAVALLGVMAAVVTALTLPGAGSRPVSARKVPGLVPLRLTGALAMVGFFVIFAIIPGLIGARIPAARLAGWQAIPAILMCFFFALVVAIRRSWSGRGGWGHRQTLAVITGVLLPTIVVSMVLPLALRTLEPLATVPMLVLLIRLASRDRAAHRLVAVGPEAGRA
jgi:hypothetical protein